MIGKTLFFLIRNKYLISFLLFISTILILALTMLPSSQLGSSSLYQYDKLGHFGLFFIWTFLFGLFIFSRKNFNAKLLVIFLIGSIFGITVEILQDILPFGRNVSVYDAIADIAGSFTATALLYGIKHRYKQRYRELLAKRHQ